MTDWNLIRKLTNAAIDACESVEHCGITDENQSTTFINDSGKESATAWEYLQSAHTYPENLIATIIRARHQLQEDKHYTNEAARTLCNVARVCAELVGTDALQRTVIGADPFNRDAAESIEQMIAKLIAWYENHFSDGIRRCSGSNMRNRD